MTSHVEQEPARALPSLTARISAASSGERLGSVCGCRMLSYRLPPHATQIPA